jgi:hypothetical protein
VEAIHREPELLTHHLSFTLPLNALSMARWPYCPEYETPTVSIEVSA